MANDTVVANLKATLSLDTSGFTENVDKTTKSTNDLTGAILKADLIKGVLEGVGKVAEAVTGLIKESVQAFAEYEQLAGGVETLFGDSAEAVMKNAEAAYQTAGISANKYMEQATSFSASLLNSLGGDTEKAAAFADMAIRDMSDNANKMGTDIGRIQDAYQGFAKQNYTMLDNLKLGYGGTKTEMERLLADAEKLTGIHYDISNLDDVFAAIHVIQEELGITGTTAEEAMTTIEGSQKQMEASWDNLLVSMVTGGEWFDECIQAFVDSVLVYVENLLPAIEGAMMGFSALITSLAPMLIEMLPGLVETLLPGFLDAIMAIITSILTALPDILTALTAAIPMVVDALVDLVPTLVTSITDCAGQLIDAGITLLKSLIDGLANNVDTIVPALTQAVIDIALKLTEIITNDTTNLATSALALVNNLADALLKAIPVLLEALPQIITSLVVWLSDPNNLIEMYSAALEIFGTLVSNVPAIIEALVTGLTQIVTGIADHFRNHGGDMVAGIGDGLAKLKDQAVTIWEEKIKPAFDELGEFFKTWFLQFEWGETFLTFVDQISDKIKELWDKVKEAFTGEEGFFGKVKAWFAELDLSTVVTGLLTGLKSAFSIGWDTLRTIIDGADGFLGKIKSWFSEVDLTEAATAFLENLKAKINGAWNSIKEWFSQKLGGLFSGALKLFGGGKEEETPTTEEETPEGSIDMPANMMTLDYNNLTPIPEDVIASYQALADAIMAINRAIMGGGEEGAAAETTAAAGEEEAAGMSLMTALQALPDAFLGILTAATQLADYFNGSFQEAVAAAIKVLAKGGTNDKGETSYAGGNTLYTAAGAVKGVFEDIVTATQEMIRLWNGPFSPAVNKLKEACGIAEGAAEAAASAAESAAVSFNAWADAIERVISALKKLGEITGGGAGDGGSGFGFGFGGFRALGGEVGQAKTYVVGEEGPELFVPKEDGYIVSNDELEDNADMFIPHPKPGGEIGTEILEDLNAGSVVIINFNGDVIGDEESISGYVENAARTAMMEEIYAAL